MKKIITTFIILFFTSCTSPQQLVEETLSEYQVIAIYKIENGLITKPEIIKNDINKSLSEIEELTMPIYEMTQEQSTPVQGIIYLYPNETGYSSWNFIYDNLVTIKSKECDINEIRKLKKKQNKGSQ